MALPFGLTEVQFFEERAGRAELFLDGAVEFFRLLAQSSLLISATQARERSHPGVVPEYATSRSVVNWFVAL